MIAAEHFPSHFKGYVDAQAAQFVEMGADVSFVALGRWWPTVDPIVRKRWTVDVRGCYQRVDEVGVRSIESRQRNRRRESKKSAS